MNTTSDVSQEQINAKRATICWHCAKACGGCSWSDGLKPVNGWTVTETHINCIGQGYIVIKCPEYVDENSNKRQRPENFDPDGCERLIQRIAGSAADDYIKCPSMRSDITKWFRSKEFSNLSGANPEVIISRLKVLAREHDKKLEEIGRP